MEDYIQISKINDFIFCPKSLYFHSVYEGFTEKVYHGSPQIKGKIKHENIEQGKYSTAEKHLQGFEVYSERYNIAGKIDIYDKENKALIERKNKISRIYDGYKYQLYAQCFCLLEMGYEVKKMYIHSLSDNKRYQINMPDQKAERKFAAVISEIREFNIQINNFVRNPAKCARCIYRELCG